MKPQKLKCVYAQVIRRNLASVRKWGFYFVNNFIVDKRRHKRCPLMLNGIFKVNSFVVDWSRSLRRVEQMLNTDVALHVDMEEKSSTEDRWSAVLLFRL